jgi:putative nonproteinogenic amino acid hydroxylase
MQARIVGTVPLEHYVLDGAIEQLRCLPRNDQYDEFSFGYWKNAVLVNGTGSHHDSRLRPYAGPCRTTPLAANLPWLFPMLEEHFELSHLRWLRVFFQGEGVLLPHVDFIDLDEGFTRIHLPVHTTRDCLHSESAEVYHMRAGELWIIQATKPHSACNYGNDARITLCLDFAPGVAVRDLLRRPEANGLPEPTMIARSAPTDSEIAAFRGIANAVADDNFQDTLRTLSFAHFRKRLHSRAMFSWLTDAARAKREAPIFDRINRTVALALGSGAEELTGFGVGNS